MSRAAHSDQELNVTRTRVTVLMLMLSIMASRGLIAEQAMAANLATKVALFVGFCLTILGLLWLLTSLRCCWPEPPRAF